ncbi:MAG: type III pantothenate kinase [Saprospiraceae bacterium]|nr:type III pantothenate kinase [Saprospiraceae bacterium]
MNLILDFGNTFQKIAVFDKKELIEIKSFKGLNLNDIETFIKNYDINSAIISSVINYPNEINDFLKNKFRFIKLDSQTPIPIINKYKTPNTLGNDRLAAIVGANAQFPASNVLVIEAGTCITYDFINSNNEYLGGSISPGINMRYKALHNFTDKLPLVELKDNKKITGQTTEESISSGVENGVLAEVDGIIQLYKKKYSSLKSIISGGDINFFDKKLKNSIFAVSNIVLIGLNEILEFNDK